MAWPAIVVLAGIITFHFGKKKAKLQTSLSSIIAFNIRQADPSVVPA